MKRKLLYALAKCTEVTVKMLVKDITALKRRTSEKLYVDSCPVEHFECVRLSLHVKNRSAQGDFDQVCTYV